MDDVFPELVSFPPDLERTRCQVEAAVERDTGALSPLCGVAHGSGMSNLDVALPPNFPRREALTGHAGATRSPGSGFGRQSRGAWQDSGRI